MKAVCQVTDRSDVWMTGWCGSSVRRRLNHHHHHVHHHHQQQQQQYHRDVRWCLLKQTTHYITASGRVYSGLRCIQTLDKDNSRKTINRCCRLWPNNQSINQSITVALTLKLSTTIHETDGTCLITVIDWWKTHALLTLTLPCLVRLRNFFLSSSQSWRMLSSNFCGSWNSTYFLPAHSVPSQPLFLNLSSTIIGTISLFCSFAYCPSTHVHTDMQSFATRPSVRSVPPIFS